MERRILLPLLVLACAFLLWRLEPGEEAPAPAGPGARERTEGPGGARPAPAPGEALHRQGAGLAFEAPPPPGPAPGITPAWSGRVLDPEGRPLAGVWILCLDGAGELRSDGEGRFVLPPPPGGGTPAARGVHVVRAGFLPLRARLRRGAEARLVLQPTGPEGLRTVRVTDAGGTPLAGAVLERFEGLPPDPAGPPVRERRWLRLPEGPWTTDAAGEARVPAGEGGVLRARLAGHRDAVVALTGVQARGSLRLRLEPAGGAPLVLTDGSGAPLAGALLDLGGPAGASLAGREWRADASGLADAADLPLRSADRLLVWTPAGRGWVEDTSGGRLSPGVGVVCAFRRLEGRVEGAPAGSRIATAALTGLFGGTPVPDPWAEAGRLLWEPLGADGSFVLERGWQGPALAWFLETPAGEILRLREGEDGLLRLPERIPVTVAVRAEPASALEGLRARLESLSLGAGPQPRARTLVQGRAQFEVEPGAWRLLLDRDGWPAEREAARFELQADPLEVGVDLGRLRTLRLRVTAGGEPPGPGVLRLRDPRRRGEPEWEIPLPASGEVLLPELPEASLEVEVETEDPWLRLPPGTVFPVPAGAGEMELEIPTARLALVPPPGLAPGGIRVRRLARLEGGALRTLPGGGALHWPAASGEAVRLTPSVLRFQAPGRTEVLEPGEVELRAGEVRSLELGLQTWTEVLPVVEGAGGRWRLEIAFEPLDPALPPPRPLAPAAPVPEGAAARSWALAPGPWRVVLPSPPRRLDRPGGEVLEAGEGPWEARIEVPEGLPQLLVLQPSGPGGLRLALRADERKGR